MRFELLRTDRLLLRPVRQSDAAALAERRNDPAVAEYQTWSRPFPLERAEEMIAAIEAMDGPANDEWWMLTIADLDDQEVLGDLAVHLTWSGRSAEIGYTLARPAWGHGFAAEAVEALVGWLWSWPALTRVHAMLHPDNTASAQVVERTGFDFEGRTRLSYWVGDDNSDDSLYGMTRTDWEAWQARPHAAPASVRLVEITAGNSRAVRSLRTHRSQERFVSSVTKSIGDAAYPDVVDGAPLRPWLRAVEADGELVGFVMMSLVTPQHPEPFLWRLLVDRRHQRRGIGSRVIELIVDEVRALGSASLMVSWGEGRGSPAPLYLRRGFVPTGEVEDDEIVARRTIEAGGGEGSA